MCYLGVCYVAQEECVFINEECVLSNRKECAGIWPGVGMFVMEECVFEFVWIV